MVSSLIPADSVTVFQILLSSRLCGSGTAQYISHRPTLSSARIHPPLLAASEIAWSLESDPTDFPEYTLGTRWIDDPPLQREIFEFIHNLHAERPLSTSPHSIAYPIGYSPSVEVMKKK